MNNTNKEIEVRFLDIDKAALEQKLLTVGAKDLGEEVISDTAFYDQEGKWMKQELKGVRLRHMRGKNLLAFKHSIANNVNGMVEIEVEVSDFGKAKEILEAIGLVAYREVEKKRHSFNLGEVAVDIDTWPTIPPLVEFEGTSEQELKDVTARFGFDWSQAVFEPSIVYLETRYNIPIAKIRVFTFDKIVKV
jgi:adenylate cyclase, class 2